MRRLVVVVASWLLIACNAAFLGGASDDGQDDGAPDAGSGSDTGDNDIDLGPELDAYVESQMTSSGIVGLSAAIVKGTTVRWTHGYGKANIAANKPVTPDTLFMLASISKTFVGVAAMQLVEEGRLNLDADINPHLPFSVRNPRFAAVPITMRHLLTHTSSIEDTDAPYEFVVDGDSPLRLGDWLRSYLTSAGANYSTAVYGTARPGARYAYSNEGNALASYVVERIAGVGFDTFSTTKIFTPLGMTASWHLAGLDVTQIATPHDAGAPVAHYGYPDYPSGSLRTSGAHLARFLSMMAQKGTFDGTQLLTEASVAEMLRPQVGAVEPSQGLIFYFTDLPAGGRVWGHDGLDPGVRTVMGFRPTDGVGVLVLTNGLTSEDGMFAVFERLFVEAAKL